jgi:hypothetical protein
MMRSATSPNFLSNSSANIFPNPSNDPYAFSRPGSANPMGNTVSRGDLGIAAATSGSDFFGVGNNTASQPTLRPSTAGPTLSKNNSAVNSAVKLPRYVETDKQIARFFGHFFQDRPFERYGPLGGNVVERKMCRYMTIMVYIYDGKCNNIQTGISISLLSIMIGTVEITEPRDVNSGMSQGTFFRRGELYKTNGEKVELTDLLPGHVVHMLGQEFYITDADAFTRDYFK